MAIEVAGGVQTELTMESREERLQRLFLKEVQIMTLRQKRQQLIDQSNSIKNQIKAEEKDKLDLMNKLEAGQLTINVTNVPADEGWDEPDYPSEDELNALDDTDDGKPCLEYGENGETDPELETEDDLPTTDRNEDEEADD